MADDVAALVRHLGIERADVMGYSLGGGVALQTAIRHPEVVARLVVVSTPFRRDAFYPEILAQQGYVNAAAAEMMRQTPMYQLYAAIAPRPEEFPRLLEKIGEAMKVDFDFSRQIAGIAAPTLVVAGDADIFPPAHAVELFGLLGGGQRDGGWDGSGRPASRLAILPGVTHYTIFADPALAAAVLPFLGEAAG
jgi:pimeloyl-ACP methyl ester carboxylesterase